MKIFDIDEYVLQDDLAELLKRLDDDKASMGGQGGDDKTDVIIRRRLSPRTPGPPWQTSKVEMPGSEERKQSVLGTLRDRRSERSLRGRAPRAPARSRDPNRTLNSEYLSIACMKTYDL